MKRLLFILLASAWACSPVGYSQSDALKAASENYQELKEQGRYREAIPYAQEVLAFMEEDYGPEHPNVATSLNALAALYIYQGRYGEAEKHMKRALAIITEAPKKTSPSRE